MQKFSILLILAYLLTQGAPAAPHPTPPKTFQEIIGGFHPSHFQQKPALRVTTARVLFADYDLIRRDFQITRPMSDAQIEEWLLRSSAVISRDQIDVGERRGVNEKIFHDPASLSSTLRPPQYGRALVVEVEGGILDAKGAGGLAQAISQNSHRNGLMETAEALREFSLSKLVKRALHHAESDFTVIDSYAVLDFGFLMKSSVDDSLQPAGLLLRQSHFRDISISEQLPANHAIKIERMLRKFGITTAYKKTNLGSEEKILYDVLNVQGSDAGKFLYDFGGYRITDHFGNHAITLADLFEKKSIPVMKASHFSNIQPDPKFASLFQSFGGEGTEEKLWNRSREIAKRFRNDGIPEKTRQEVKALLEVILVIPGDPSKDPLSCKDSLLHP